jgi:hypothetical protein
MRKVILLLATLALPGCSADTVYLRTDGQDLASNSDLRRQMELDRLTCQTEDTGDSRDCMAVKGYVSVPKYQAAAKQRQLADIAAQNAAANDVTSVLPPPVPPDKTAAAKKRKPKPADNNLRSSKDWRLARLTFGKTDVEICLPYEARIELVAGAVSGWSLRAKMCAASDNVTSRSGLFLTAAL